MTKGRLKVGKNNFLEYVFYSKFGCPITHNADLLNNIIENFIDFKVNSLVDLGCGDGKITAEIAKKLDTRNILGMDINENLLNLCNFNTMCLDLTEKIKLKDKLKFDLALIINFLHHTKRKRMILENAKSLSKNIIVVEPVYSEKKLKRFFQKIYPFEWGREIKRLNELKGIFSEMRLNVKKESLIKSSIPPYDRAIILLKGDNAQKVNRNIN